MKSNKNDGGSKRLYRMNLRAQRMEETRLRITEALVELHRTVGPARATVSEVAKRAGVRRMTVYNHFPTDLEMIDACSSHWVSANPPPDPEEWARIRDPDERARRGLEELYRYYRRNRDMVGNFVRDAPLVPALAEIMGRKWFPLIETMADTLVADRNATPAGERTLRAVVEVALAYETWRTLTKHEPGDEAAARVAAAMITGALDATDPSGGAT
jgi:AcrR family transcriptional regulator